MKKLLLILLCLPMIGFSQIPGCTDSLACNYDSTATIDDSSCVYIAIAPYYEDFGNGILPAGICGWSQWEISGDGWRFDSLPAYAALFNGRNTGTYAWIDFSYTDSSVVLEVEDIDVSNLSSPTLLFDFYSYLDTFSTGPINILNVETWDGISWVTQNTYQVNISGWHTYNVDLSNATYSTNIVKLRFRGESGGSGVDYFNDLLLDDVKIENAGCTDPLACNYDSLATIDDSSCNYFTILYDTVIVNNSYNWHNTILSVSGDYIDTLVNLVGCDSIIYLNLTITNTTGIIDLNNKNKLVKITDMLGQETPYRRNTPLFYIYDDGTVEKRITIE